MNLMRRNFYDNLMRSYVIGLEQYEVLQLFSVICDGLKITFDGFNGFLDSAEHIRTHGCDYVSVLPTKSSFIVTLLSGVADSRANSKPLTNNMKKVKVVEEKLEELRNAFHEINASAGGLRLHVVHNRVIWDTKGWKKAEDGEESIRGTKRPRRLHISVEEVPVPNSIRKQPLAPIKEEPNEESKEDVPEEKKIESEDSSSVASPSKPKKKVKVNSKKLRKLAEEAKANDGFKCLQWTNLDGVTFTSPLKVGGLGEILCILLASRVREDPNLHELPKISPALIRGFFHLDDVKVVTIKLKDDEAPHAIWYVS